MSLFRKLKRYAPKAKQLAEDNAGKIADGVKSATDFVDDKTKGKYRDKLDKVDKAAEDFAEKTEKAASDSDEPGGDATDGDGGPGDTTP